MIKITCTKEEQETIINIIARNETDCLFDEVESVTKTYSCRGGTLGACWDCLRKNIEWDIYREADNDKRRI